MRIGIDLRSLLDKEPSGVSAYTKELLQALFKLDKVNEYFLFANKWDQAGMQASLSKLTFLNQPNVHLKLFHYPNKLFHFCTHYLGWPKIDKLIGGVDIFFVPNLHFIALSKHCKKILTVHDLSFKIFPQFLSWHLKMRYALMRPKKLCLTADKIIAVSESTERDLIELYQLSKEKIKIIYSGINPAAKSDGGRNQLPEKYILSLATFEPRKNIISLIWAFKKLTLDPTFQGYKLILAGPQGWKTKALLKALGKDPRIKILGYVSEAEKAELLARACVFVYPSFYEGFGFPPLEAMAQGTPVIASGISSLPEILGSAALLINPYNNYDLLMALKEVLTDDKLRVQLISAGKIQVQKFTWEKTAQETLALFV